MYEIKKLDMGLTTRCQAGCPQCPRTDPSTNRAWDWMRMEELTIGDIQKILPPDQCSKIERFSLCGGYGDPLLTKDLFKIIEYFRTHAPKAPIHIATNGSMKNPRWWHTLGKLLKNNKGVVTFGIDGIDQKTHETYRVNTKLENIFNHAEILQLYKISTRWQFLSFNYNQHQLEEAKRLAKEKHFDDFIMLTSTRPPVGDNFYPPTRSPDIISTSRSRKYNYFTGEKFDSIDCLSEKDSEVHLTASGIVVPCCYIDERFTISRYPAEIAATRGYKLEDIDPNNPIAADVINLYQGIDLNRFNAKIHGLEKVLEDPWWDMFFKLSNELKIHKCNDICGIKCTTV